ncbi:hypothetical protein MSPP1_000987 [Malassezia sp. CBS 17886]|nr:hypothetical protein MSPP1_000987 [Malassezia sp. CBS 17886]
MLKFTPLAGPHGWGGGDAGGADAGASADASERAGASVPPAPPATEHAKAVAYLLEIDNVRILLDCGAPEDFLFGAPPRAPPAVDRDPVLDGPLPEILARIAPSIDVVLLTHAELAHIGLYAYAYAHYGLKCPAYATLPVQKMGRLALLEAARSWRGEVDVAAAAPARVIASDAEIEEAFDTIRAVRYLQPMRLDGKCVGLVLTAYNAGHTLGGAVWKLRSPSSGTVVMALDWNHHRERHLDGTALLATAGADLDDGRALRRLTDSVGRPDILITDAERALCTNARRKDRDAVLLDRIHHTLQGGHSVLIPVDASARVLELLVLLDQHWAYTYKHQRFPICFVSHTGQEVVERARTFLEWMSRDCAAQMLAGDAKGARRRDFGRQHALRSPLEFPYLRHFASVEALHQALAPSQVKVVIATPPSLTHGHARALLPEFLSDPDSLVILTSRGAPGSIVRTLWERWNAQQARASGWRDGAVGTPASVGGSLSYELRRKVRLTGDELREHVERAQQAAAAAAPPTAPTRARPRREADEDGDSSASSGDESADDAVADEGGGPGSRLLTSTRDIAPDRLGAAHDGAAEVSFDIFVRGAAGEAHGAHGGVQHFRMFPLVERKRKVDGYGESIDNTRWLSRRRRLEAEQEAQLDPHVGAARARGRAEKERAAQPPSKYVCETLCAAVRCHVLYVDLEGLNDGRALKTLLPQLQPRRLVLVNGDAAATTDLLAMLRSVRGMTDELFAPAVGESVCVGELSHAYSVTLADSLMGGLRWSQVEDYQVVHLHVVPEFSANADVPMLTWPAPADAETTREDAAPSTLYIGDLRLPALQARLARQHRIRSDFAGEGVLVCDGAPTTRVRANEPRQRTVTVSKEGAGRIVVEGNVGHGLARVRQAVYDLYAQVDR